MSYTGTGRIEWAAAGIGQAEHQESWTSSPVAFDPTAVPPPVGRPSPGGAFTATGPTDPPGAAAGMAAASPPAWKWAVGLGLVGLVTWGAMKAGPRLVAPSDYR